MSEEKSLNLIIDTREQDPLDFTGYPVHASVDKLDAGDYTLVGHDRPKDDFSVIIERKKNCSELLRNIGANWDTFQLELDLMNEYHCKQIVICGPNNFSYLIQKGLTQLNLNFIYKRLAQIQSIYDVSTLFLGTREDATNYIYRLFKEYEVLNRD